MDFRYMMLKDKYRFVYSPQISLYSIEDSLRRGKEISLYLKELSLYGINLKLLSKIKPSHRIKDELLNIAYFCFEDNGVSNIILAHRELPIKRISELTYKSKGFIEKWKYYIIAYMLLLSNDTYINTRKYLSIQFKAPNQQDDLESTALTVQDSQTYMNPNAFTGVLLKKLKNICYILTPYGDFVKIKPSQNSELSIGYICNGARKKDITFYKYPIAIGFLSIIILGVVASFLYMNTVSTVLVQANGTIKLEVNPWNRVVRVTPLSGNGIKIIGSTKFFNTTVDESLLLILSQAKSASIIKENTKISIFITGEKRVDLVLDNTEAFIRENNLNVLVNNNGNEIKIDKSSQ